MADEKSADGQADMARHRAICSVISEVFAAFGLVRADALTLTVPAIFNDRADLQQRNRSQAC